MWSSTYIYHHRASVRLAELQGGVAGIYAGGYGFSDGHPLRNDMYVAGQILLKVCPINPPAYPHVCRWPSWRVRHVSFYADLPYIVLPVRVLNKARIQFL
jgi:hypothetical protein